MDRVLGTRDEDGIINNIKSQRLAIDMLDRPNNLRQMTR